MRIQVCDLGGLCNVTVAKISVRTNRFPPVLDPNRYDRTIPETWPYGLPIFDVNATDSDAAPPNNQFRFSLQAAPQGDSLYDFCFGINAVDGVIFAKQPLYPTFENPCDRSQYSFQVVATDLGTPALTSTAAPVNIIVTKNSNPPRFLQDIYRTNFDDTEQMGYTVQRVSADDPDAAPFNVLSYNAIGDDDATAYFSISQVDNNNVVVTLQTSVQNSGKDFYRLRLLVEDSGLPTLTGTAVVEITINRNLNPPSFNPTTYPVTIDEDQQLGLTIGTVTATDPDSPKPGAGEVEYSVQSGSDGADYFTVDPLTGEIQVYRDLTADGQNNQNYELYVEVRDRGNPSQAGTNTATVLVTVNRNLNCPTLTTLPAEITINETDTGIIFTAQAQDNDNTVRFSTPRFTIVGDGANGIFFVNQNTGEISVTGGLATQQDRVYKLQVIVNDGFCLDPDQRTLTVNVNRNLRPPRWTGAGPSFTRQILETFDVTQTVIILTAEDDDTGFGSQVRYEFEPNSPHQDLFIINPTTGATNLRRTMVGLTGRVYQMNIRAVDDGGLSTSGTLTVTVLRNDFAPVITNLPTNRTVRSDVSTNQQLFQCQSSDDDSQDNENDQQFSTVNYRLVGEGRAVSIFQVDAANCILTLRTPLTTDTAEMYTVLIEAYDLAGAATKSSTATFTVYVDRNLQPPVFRTISYSQTILEIQDVYDPFLQVDAVDNDAPPYNVITYEAVSTGDATVLDYFGVNANGGLICLQSQWLYPDDTRTRFEYGIILRDNGGQVSARTATVSVTVIRNTAPVYTGEPYSRTIQETASDNSLVFTPTVRETDTRDPFNRLSFSLIGDDSAAAFFDVNPSTGAVTVKPNSNLGTDSGTSYKVRVRVEDGGTPPLSDTTVVSVTVSRNNFDPTFGGNLERRIPFNTPVGSLIVDVNATDLDNQGPEAQLTYSIVDGHTFRNREYFIVLPGTGELILRENQDLADVDSFTIRMRATDNGVPRRSGDVIVTVIIEKDPDQLTCGQTPYRFSTSETSGVDTFLGTVNAGPGTVQYSVVGYPPGDTYFKLDADPLSGRVLVASGLKADPAQLKDYVLLVQATRSVVSTQTVTCTVSISVTRNPSTPDWALPSYDVSIPDTTPTGEIIGTIQATDADGDSITYSILSGTPTARPFYLHPSTGNVTLVESQRNTNTDTYVLNVRASDVRGADSKFVDTTFTVRILRDRADPQFSASLYQFQNIREDSSTGTSIGRVTASDSDLKGQLVFEVIGNSTAPGLFRLGPSVSSGPTSATASVEVRDGPYLRRDQSSSYILNLIVYDSAYPDKRDTSEVLITMRRNLNAPQLNNTNYRVTIPDSTPAGMFIYKDISASDIDNDVLLFEIIGGLRREYYDISPRTGYVSLARSLIGTTHSEDQLTVRVRDQRQPEQFDTATLTVTITRDDFPPRFTNLPRTTGVTFATQIPSVIYTVTAVDQDLEERINYELVGNFPAPSYFYVDNARGTVTLNASLVADSLQLEEYTLKFIAYDTRYPTNQATSSLTVTLNRNPNPPTCNPASITTTLDKQALPGDVLANITATDPEGFTVVASDQGRPTPQTCTTTVQFTLGTDLPPFFRPSNSYTWGIEKDAFSTGAVYTGVDGADNDLQGSLVYEVTGSLSAPRYFSVDTATARISISRDLNDDIRTQYQLLIAVYDSVRPSNRATATVTISVDRNPNPPTVNPGQVTISELTPVFTNIFNVTASDNGDGETLRYRLEASPTSLAGLRYFWIDPDTGFVRVQASLKDNSRVDTTYSLTVVVNDQSLPPKEASAPLTIIVQRNKNTPFFVTTPYRLTISEKSATGSVVYTTVEARDTDLRESIAYEVVGNGAAPYFFSVDRSNGDITLLNDLRTDTALTYTLRIRAYDTAYPEDYVEENVLFTVTRNEDGPEFNYPTPISVTIEETEPVGRIITIVNATDNSGQDILTFTATTDTDTLQLFSLDPYTGAVSVKTSLYNLPKDTYTMNVVVTDNGVQPRTGTVQVFININRYPGNPVISPDPCRTSVSENLGTGSRLLSPVISSTDSNTAGVLRYRVDGEYPAQYIFDVNPSTGAVTTLRHLRYDTLGESQYLLRVIVYDTLRPQRTDTVTCTISIIRNSNTPQWDLPRYQKSIPEDQPYISDILNVTATDQDPGDVISYRIVDEQIQRDFSSSPSQYFQINTETGTLMLVRSVKDTNINRFLITVEACDNGIPQRCINTTVQIDITRIRPVISCGGSLTNSINENDPIGTQVLDVDGQSNQQLDTLVYELLYPNPIALSIDSTTGRVTLAEAIADDAETTVTVRVEVYDRAQPDRRTTCTGTIFISRNTEGPVFTESVYRTTISEYHPLLEQVINTTAIDRDGDTVYYSIIGSNQPRIGDIFYMDPLTGVFILRTSLEGTTTTFYNITVQATDNAPINLKQDIALVYITVELDAYPQFSPPYIVPLSELQPIGALVRQITATDSDQEGVILYEADGLYPAESFFAINQTTGLITVTGDLKQDPLQLSTYLLRVIAYDSPHPARQATATVTLSVTRDPNNPIFQPNSNYFETVDETAPISTVVVPVRATDADQDPITYSIVTPGDENASEFFFMDPTSGDISVKKDLRQANDSYQFQVFASDGRGTGSFASVRINVRRIPGDQPPQFEGTPYNIPINKYQAQNTPLRTVRCTDPDLNQAQETSRIQYNLVGFSPGSDYFALATDTGTITLIQPLSDDNFGNRVYTLVVECYDSQNPDLTTQTTVVITVDRNPNCPRFISNSYSMGINENYLPQTFVLQVNATDDDGDIVSYYIDQTTPGGSAAAQFFFVSASTGEIYVRDSLQNAAASYSFDVSAYDNGIPQCQRRVRVTITIQRDAGAPFCNNNNQQLAPISENVPNNTRVHGFIGSDGDIQGTLEFTQAGDALAWGYFSLTPDGQVFTRRSLASTRTSRFELQVAVADSFYPRNYGYCRVTVIVSHNVGVPRFTPTSRTISIFEYEPPGFNFLNVTATDPDNDRITYSLVGGSDDEQFFSVDGDDGRLFLRQSLSLSTTSFYTFEVIGTDSRLGVTNTGTVTVSVNVQRDQRPVCIGLPRTVPRNENDVAGTFVAQLQASDGNQLGGLVFNAIGEAAAPSMFNVNASGYVSVKADLILDTTRLAIPTVRTTCTLSISVSRNPNPPEFTQNPYGATLNINTQPGDVVATVRATDRDGDTPTYYILSGDSSYFVLDPNSGAVTLVKQLDSILSGSLRLRVQARDRPLLGLTDEADVIFSLSLQPNLPRFINNPPYSAGSVQERVPIGTAVFTQVSAVDSDLQGNLTYAVRGDFPADYFFTIDSNTGIVRVAQDLTTDSLSRGTYVLRIIAYDSSFPDQTAETTVTIPVQHNPSGPIFSGVYERTISERHALGDPIFNFTARDDDGDSLTYTLIRDNNGQDALQYFYVQRTTGLMYLWRSLESASQPRYEMTVRVADSGRPTRTADVTATVIISQVNPPRFTPPTAPPVSVEESRPIDRFVYDVNANIIPNPVGSIKYRLVGTGLGPYYFKIDENTGVISVKNNLTTSCDPTYTLEVQAYDDAFPDVTGTFTLTVNMIRNQNQPRLTIDQGGINEQTEPGSVILTAVATDADTLDTLTFSLTGSSECQRLFFLNPQTGQLYLAAQNTELTSTSYRCTIRVTDNGCTARFAEDEVIIPVSTEPAPSFTFPSYTARVDENNGVGTSLLTVTATKTPTRGVIMYEIVGDYPGQSFFAINNRTGEVTIDRDLRLDSLKQGSYVVRIEAYDSAFPRIRQSTTLTVTVDRNIYGPIANPVSVTIPETTDPGTWSFIVNATDRDSNVLTCSIVSNQKAQEYFRVDPRTCVLSLTKSLTLDPDNTNPYLVTIRITDDGQPPKTSDVTVTVNVPRDIFDPRFLNLPETRTIPEGQAPGTLVLDVNAQDNDRQSQIRCDMVGDYPSSLFFAVDPNTCAVTVLREPALDPEGRETYVVRIRAYDIAWPDNYVEDTLTIRVQRNVNPPRFGLDRYSFPLSDTTPPGTNVYNLTASDGDDDVLRFYATSTDPEFLRTFYVNGNGAIVLLRPLESTDDIFTFGVGVSDDRSPPKTDDAQVTVTIQHPPGGPPTFLGTPFVNDVRLDTSGRIVYNLKPLRNAGNYFSMNPSTGALTLIRRLTEDADRPQTYVMLVEAYDSAVPEEVVSEPIYITVSRNNYDPDFAVTSYTGRVYDFDPVGTSVGQVTATDNDPQAPENTIIYRLSDSRNPLDYFTIDPYSGLVTVAKRLSDTPLDNPPNSYRLYITATDSSAEPREATVPMDVTVIRNTAPFFPGTRLYDRTVGDETAIGSTIVTVAAQDNDDSNTQNGQIFYEIVESGVRSTFNIDPDTGGIYTVRSMQDVSRTTWDFTVKVSDKGIPAKTATTPVTFTITTTAPIRFVPARVVVQQVENAPVNTLITDDLSATDPLNNELCYSIEGDGQAREYFTINNRTAQIYLAKPFTEDRLKATAYVIRVAAIRCGDEDSKTYGFVEVNVNRNPTRPVFNGEFVFNIFENQPLGQTFGNVSAVDPDTGDAGRLTYSITAAGSSPSYGVDYFYINPTNGDLSVKTSLTQDSTVQYLINVKARDAGSPVREGEIRATINVARNPNPPRFTRSSYYREIEENFAVNGDLLTVTATDKDGDRVSYSIVRDTQDALYFNIDDNGVLTLARSVLNDPTTLYEFRVQASDNREPPGLDVATVLVNVTRNKNAPTFGVQYFNKSISEYHEFMTSVHQVIATDNDPSDSPSGRIRYSMTATNLIAAQFTATNYFTISPTSGTILLARDLKTDIAPDAVRLVIVATDGAITPKSASTTVDVYIVRNLFAPRFFNAPYEKRESPGTGLGVPILTVSATDDDTGVELNKDTPNAEIEYLVVEGPNSRYFQIDGDGQVSKRRTINLVADGDVNLFFQVMVRDKSWKPKSTIANVTITVTISRTTAGKLGFDRPTYFLQIPENQVANTEVTELKVENQGERRVQCRILSEVPNLDYFSIDYTVGHKNCILILRKNLDREVHNRHVVNVDVIFEGDEQPTRRKRQAANNASLYVFNVWQETQVVIDVLDINDNSPKWEYPVYPNQTLSTPRGTRDKYIGAISRDAKPQTPATDLDLGNNGTVEYDMANTFDVPFDIVQDSGALYTTDQFTSEFVNVPVPPRQYTFRIVARDLGDPFQATPTDVIINIIEDVNRFILPVNGMKRAEVLPKQEDIRRRLQEETGMVIIIEEVVGKRSLQSNNNIQTLADSTDIVFVVGYPNNDYTLINATSKTAEDLLLSEGKQTVITTVIGNELNKEVDNIRLPFGQTVIVRTMITKSYIWFTDDPWAPLVALAGIIILLAIAAIIYLIFSNSRYMKFINQYRIYQSTYDNPDFVEPPSFLREYETQSLNMYVPPDEVLHSYGEIGLRLQGDGLVDVQHTSHDPGVAAAVNPVYQSEPQGAQALEPQPQQVVYPESTTIL
ncbi:hypothetical protein BaRGS_00026419 [Batillaria attramentaria]|uniref:Cadherin domain-containing protein n=1 Tax=Batillaria attramentaria TaxID=370345 RepID=A0ABD0K5T3_9CAEN